MLDLWIVRIYRDCEFLMSQICYARKIYGNIHFKYNNPSRPLLKAVLTWFIYILQPSSERSLGLRTIFSLPGIIFSGEYSSSSACDSLLSICSAPQSYFQIQAFDLFQGPEFIPYFSASLIPWSLSACFDY